MRNERLRLADILEAIDRIESYTIQGRGAFLASRFIQDAVIRNFEIIGEAVKALPDPTKSRFPAIPWMRIAGLRDVLIHAYFRVRLQEVWGIVESGLAPLKKVVQQLVRPAKRTRRKSPTEKRSPGSTRRKKPK